MSITFDKNLSTKSETEGYLTVADDPSSPLPRQDEDTLLHLLFWLTYTRVGRKFLLDRRPRSNNKNPAVIQSELRQEFDRRLRDRGPGLTPKGTIIDALVAAHFSADAFVNSLQPDGTGNNAHDAAYKQNLDIVMKALTEDSQEHEFSMNW